MRSRVNIFIALAVVVLVVIGGLILFQLKRGGPAADVQAAKGTDTAGQAGREVVAPLREGKTVSATKKTPGKKQGVESARPNRQTNRRSASSSRGGGSGSPVPESVEQITEELDSLLDDENYDALLAEAKKLIKNPNAEVRSRVAFALHWAGLKGLGDLTSMLADPDPEVAQEAYDYWKTALADIEHSSDKAAMLDAAYAVTGDFTDNKLLDDILSEFTFVDEGDASAHLVEMARQSKNPEHVKMMIEAMDEISQPEKASENLDHAISELRRRERERAEEEDGLDNN